VKPLDRAEEAAHPTVLVRAREAWNPGGEPDWYYDIDVLVTPLVCAQSGELPDLYEIGASRYGFVGTVRCPCGAAVHGRDSDHTRDYLVLSTTVEGAEFPPRTLEYRELYRLGARTLDALREATGYSLIERHPGEWLPLGQLLEEIPPGAEGEAEPPPSPLRLPPMVIAWSRLLASHGIDAASEADTDTD
jgi:hypothetical protein